MTAEFPRLRLLDNPARLQSAGINRAVTEAGRPRHRILVRADAHAVYPPGYAMALADRLAALQVAWSVVPMDSRGEGCFSAPPRGSWIRRWASGGSAHRGGRRSAEVDHGHHAAMDLDWFRRIGGYDASFSHNEGCRADHPPARRAGGSGWRRICGWTTRCGPRSGRWRGNTGITAGAGRARSAQARCGPRLRRSRRR